MPLLPQTISVLVSEVRQEDVVHIGAGKMVVAAVAARTAVSDSKSELSTAASSPRKSLMVLKRHSSRFAMTLLLAILVRHIRKRSPLRRKHLIHCSGGQYNWMRRTSDKVRCQLEPLDIDVCLLSTAHGWNGACIDAICVPRLQTRKCVTGTWDI